MAGRIIILLSMFALTIRVNAQFYDLFQSYQPNFPNTQTSRPAFDFFSDFGYNQKTTRRPPVPNGNIGTTAKPKRRTTHSQNYNFEYTTAKSIRKTNKSTSNRREIELSNRNKNQALTSSHKQQYYNDATNNVDYYTEKTTTRLVPPVTQRPGVRPAPVDTNRPPITNRPPTTRPFAVYPIVTDSSAIRYPEEPDTSPEILTGPDVDAMSNAERRKYISLAEKMCDKYKSLHVQKVEAIPLLPSPEPVRLNVSVCAPITIPLVVGGLPARVEDYPHMALLGWTKLQESGYSWKCGGSLISDQYVLTASHCASQEKDDTVVTGAPRVVQLGSTYLDDTGALVVKVLSVVRHPKYARPKSYYDIALVKMVKPVTFSQVIKPACLGDPPGVGEPVIVTGWGRTEYGSSPSAELRSVSIPIWDMNQCREVLGVSRKMPTGPSRDSQVCAGDKQGGKDACQGDSGGPAQVQDGCVWRVVAVTSIGRSCGAPNTPALYAIVQKAFIAAEIFGKSITSQPTTNSQNNNPRPNINNSRPNNNEPNRNNYQGNVNNNRQDQGNVNNNRQGGIGNRNNNQGSWNSNVNTNWNSQQNTNNNANRNNNQNSWNRPNNNNGNWNSEYQSSNVNTNNNGGQNNYQYEKPSYNTGNYNPRPESTDYGSDRRGYNYNSNDYDDYYDSNREQRNIFRSNHVTTERPNYGWSNFGI